MEGNWVAECTLCKWTDRYVEQDDALKAATKHAYREHPDEQAGLQSGKWITHVQQRATDAIGDAPPKPADVVQPSPDLKIVETLDDARAISEPKPEGA